MILALEFAVVVVEVVAAAVAVEPEVLSSLLQYHLPGTAPRPKTKPMANLLVSALCAF